MMSVIPSSFFSGENLPPFSLRTAEFGSLLSSSRKGAARSNAQHEIYGGKFTSEISFFPLSFLFLFLLSLSIPLKTN